jgi:hypothetical protein
MYEHRQVIPQVQVFAGVMDPDLEEEWVKAREKVWGSG